MNWTLGLRSPFAGIINILILYTSVSLLNISQVGRPSEVLKDGITLNLSALAALLNSRTAREMLRFAA